MARVIDSREYDMLHGRRQGGMAARIGGWSARHKKSVLVGWLVFVVLAVVIGGAVGTKTLTQADGFTGGSGKAEQALAKSFPPRRTKRP